MHYYGIYRGVVVENDDSSEHSRYLGRIKISIPQVYGMPEDDSLLPWAWPCNSIFGGGIYDTDAGVVDNQVASEGDKVGSGLIAIPSIGATVWVMFEQGDPQVPVYLGTWIGKETSMPSEAKSDSSTGETYPNIFLLKMPWGPNIYFRVVGDKKLDIALNDMHIELNEDSEEGAGDGEIAIWSETKDIRIATGEGKLTLQANELDARFTTDVLLQGGTFKTTQTGDVEPDSNGNIRLIASQNASVYCYSEGSLTSGREGSWQCRAYRASGFERHDGAE